MVCWAARPSPWCRAGRGESSRCLVWSGAAVFPHLIILLHSLLGQPLYNCSLQTAQGLEEIRAGGQGPSGNGERRSGGAGTEGQHLARDFPSGGRVIG